MAHEIIEDINFSDTIMPEEPFYKSRIEHYKENRENILSGNINCIPSPFPRFRSEFPGIEHGKYYLVTGNEKSGKCFGRGTPVRLYDGNIKFVEDIVEGDQLRGPGNKPRIVQETHSGYAMMYKIIQGGDGMPFIVNGAHILLLSNDEGKHFTMSVEEYRDLSKKIKRSLYQLKYCKDGTTQLRKFSLSPIGIGAYYGFEVNEDHLFLLMDYTIVHNSQISDFMFLLHPITYAFNNRDKLSVKILYFSLEMAQSEKFDQLTCYWLYNKTRGRVRIDTKQLNSLNAESPLDPEILELLEGEEYAEFFEFLEENVIFYETIGHPKGIYNQCLTFAEQRGTYTYKEIPWTDNKTKEVKMRKVIDTFEKTNKEEYWIVITDHLSLLTTESGLNLRETIGRFSSGYSVRLRNIYKFAIVNIQQQSAESQGNEAFKLDRLSPNPGNLAENKSTKNDLNIMLGIFAPVRFNKAVHLGYDIHTFKDNIRFLEVVLNRSGSVGSVCPLYFDGAVNFFAELPRPDDTARLEPFKQLALSAQGL